MVHGKHVHLTRRERQIMDVLYARGEASVGEIQDQIPDSPSYSAVRALVRKLMDKGHVAYRQSGSKYVYHPLVPKDDAQDSAMRRLLNTFFDGSAAHAVVNLLGSQAEQLSQDDIAKIEAQLKKIKDQ
ncbi:MAG: BlaI/MecI/CopY family transcriptional regulator [Pseudomonadota bacterium]